MMYTTRLAVSLCTAFPLICIASAVAQDYFPEYIEPSDLKVGIEEFATIPDAFPGVAPRLNLVRRDPAGQLYVNDQFGFIYSISDDGADVDRYLSLRDYPELMLDSNHGEMGFKSFAFHPGFNDSSSPGYGRFYTIFASDDISGDPDFIHEGGGTAFHTLLLEWRTSDPDSNVFVPADEEAPYREVMRIHQKNQIHNSGLLSFNPLAEPGDPDYGNLYFGLGDGGTQSDPDENGQNTSNPYGALLRIDPLGANSASGNYGIASDNVFAMDEDPDTLAEIYAYGFRNPQRFSWDSATGILFAGDIGQDSVEEVNLIVNGGNYGWDAREGSFPFEDPNAVGLIDPVAEFDHTNLLEDPPSPSPATAITVGDVARGTGIEGLDGNLLVGHLSNGALFVLDVDHDPLDGGQDGLFELIPYTEQLQQVRLLDLINAKRAEVERGPMTRADLRYSIGLDNEIFVTNKWDNTIRRLTVYFGINGDFDLNEIVDGADVMEWQRRLGDGFDARELQYWSENYLGAPVSPTADAVPEPTGAVLFALGLMLMKSRRHIRC